MLNWPFHSTKIISLSEIPLPLDGGAVPPYHQIHPCGHVPDHLSTGHGASEGRRGLQELAENSSRRICQRNRHWFLELGSGVGSNFALHNDEIVYDHIYSHLLHSSEVGEEELVTCLDRGPNLGRPFYVHLQGQQIRHFGLRLHPDSEFVRWDSLVICSNADAALKAGPPSPHRHDLSHAALDDGSGRSVDSSLRRLVLSSKLSPPGGESVQGEERMLIS